MTVGRAGPQAILFTKKSETPPIWRRVAGAVAGVVACGEVRHTEALLLERFGLSEAALPKVVAVAPDGARSVYEARARPSTPPPFPTVLRPLPRTLRDRPLPLLSFPRPPPSPPAAHAAARAGLAGAQQPPAHLLPIFHDATLQQCVPPFFYQHQK